MYVFLKTVAIFSYPSSEPELCDPARPVVCNTERHVLPHIKGFPNVIFEVLTLLTLTKPSDS